MSEFRRDKLTGRWVLISPERGKKPVLLPKIKLPSKKFKSLLLKRVPVPGTNAALEIHKHLYPSIAGPGLIKKSPSFTSGKGTAHIFILSDKSDFANMSVDKQDVFLNTLSDYFRKNQKDSRVKAISFFRNQGWLAGASVPIPHYQFWAVPVESNEDTSEISWLSKNKICGVCSLIKESKPFEIKITPTAILLTRPAGRFMSEMMVTPIRHVRSFQELERVEQIDLLNLLSQGIKGLRRIYGSTVSFNEAWREWKTNDKRVHFRIEILPRINRPAGFEYGSGIYINSVRPEDAARALRKSLK